jgi:hypothetical protein
MTPRIPPEFSPYGRYLVDVDARRKAREEGGTTYFHDTENLTRKCNLDSTPDTSRSRFNSRQWAVQVGFEPCPNCLKEAKYAT